jgi:hypothetical protein
MSVFCKEYRQLSPNETVAVGEIKDVAHDLYERLQKVPLGREKSLALTKLEECVMWAVKGITG